MKKENFNDKKIEELKKDLKTNRKDLFDFNVENAQRKMKNIMVISKKKKDIARIQTAISAKDLKNAR